jgi:hypothetical protein
VQYEPFLSMEFVPLCCVIYCSALMMPLSSSAMLDRKVDACA